MRSAVPPLAAPLSSHATPRATNHKSHATPATMLSAPAVRRGLPLWRGPSEEVEGRFIWP